MTDAATTEPTAPASRSELSGRMSQEIATLDRELGEVELLIAQARTEASRHEARRVTAADKLEGAQKAAAGARGEAAAADPELQSQLVLLTKRAALMESQVDVLEGKQRALGRFREALAWYQSALDALPEASAEASAGTRSGRGTANETTNGGADPIGSLPPAVSRLLLSAQEDMRRDIARAMHDGPAQSLTNIVLQAQIVERLVGRDATRATAEAHQLVAMVQQTLDATKSFIFEVRPMVLDDLGLVPTLRRSARDRGQKAGVAVEFESMGADRRLPMDLESLLFRILDTALVGYLEAGAEKLLFKLDWSDDRLDARMTGSRAVAASTDTVAPDTTGKDLPPALAAMMEERRAAAATAAEDARRRSIVALPPTTWREIQSRAGTVGVNVELSADGDEIRLLAELPEPPSDGA